MLPRLLSHPVSCPAHLVMQHEHPIAHQFVGMQVCAGRKQQQMIDVCVDVVLVNGQLGHAFADAEHKRNEL